MTTLRYMLDTNIVSDLIRNPSGHATRRIEVVGEDTLCVSAIVASELRYGVRKNGSERLTTSVENALARLAIIPYDEASSLSYAAIRCNLEKRGAPIGYTDLFIAAHAHALGLTLVTDNIREFSRVEGLSVENWIERQGNNQ